MGLDEDEVCHSLQLDLVYPNYWMYHNRLPVNYTTTKFLALARKCKLKNLRCPILLQWPTN